MKNTTFILGADDPEMQAIAVLLNSNGHKYVHAVINEKRVQPASAYKATGTDMPVSTEHVVFVECDVPALRESHKCTIVDHHRPGDPGYDMGPENYWLGSSLGQVYSLIRPQLPPSVDQRLIAAADHCLLAAYRGQCPGIEPGLLWEHRLRQKAEFWGSSYKELDSEAYEVQLLLYRAQDEVPWLDEAMLVDTAVYPDGSVYEEIKWRGNPATVDRKLIGGAYDAGDHVGSIAWHRVDGSRCTPEDFLHRLVDDSPRLVPEVAAFYGMPTLVVRGQKVNLLAAPARLVEKFMAGEIIPVKNVYGSPARGYAGGDKYEA